MKKIIAIILTVILIFSLIACSGNKSEEYNEGIELANKAVAYSEEGLKYTQDLVKAEKQGDTQNAKELFAMSYAANQRTLDALDIALNQSNLIKDSEEKKLFEKKYEEITSKAFDNLDEIGKLLDKMI